MSSRLMRGRSEKAGGGAQQRRQGSTVEAEALLASLRVVASASQDQTVAVLREANVPGARRTRCVYLGQRSTAGAGEYEALPSLWAVPEGA